jgi:hypothetical protein
MDGLCPQDTNSMFTKSEIPPDDWLSEQVDDINRSIARVRSFLTEDVDISSIEDLPMLRCQVEIFFQAHLRRALEFLDGGKHALDAGYGLVAITAVRCLFESAACIHDFSNKMINLIEAGNIPDAVRLAHLRSFAQRFEVKERNTEMYDYTAVHILKQIDALDKAVPHARRSYEQLSEMVHPNAHGALYYFMRASEGEGERLRFGKPDDEKSQFMGLLWAGASLFSLILDDLLRFQSMMLKLMADELQSRIDDYEARKKGPKH